MNWRAATRRPREAAAYETTVHETTWARAGKRWMNGARETASLARDVRASAATCTSAANVNERGEPSGAERGRAGPDGAESRVTAVAPYWFFVATRTPVINPVVIWASKYVTRVSQNATNRSYLSLGSDIISRWCNVTKYDNVQRICFG